MEPALVLDGAARCAGGAVALEGRMIDRPAWRHLSMTQAAKQAARRLTRFSAAHR